MEADPWEIRVKKMLGCATETQSLPPVTDETLEIFFHYLNRNLIFPFEATYQKEVGPLAMKEYQVRVIGLDEHYDDFYGLICIAKDGRKKQYVAVAELELDKTNPNFTLIDDYNSWFWNNR